MGTAIYTGVTGLQVHQRRLDVIANNIANVNTTGFRAARAGFQDLFSQTLEVGTAPLGNFGGTNPTQIGLGVKLGSIDTIQTEGALVTTGNQSDLAIQGSGFFVLSDGTGQYFTRDGTFAINADGELIDPGTGMRVQGYLPDASGEIAASGVVTNLRVPVGGTSIVRATDNVTVIGNLDSRSAAGNTVTRTVRTYDSLGTARDVDVTFTKSVQVGGENAWTWQAAYNGTPVGTGTVRFDSSGRFLDTNGTSTAVSISGAVLGSPPSLPEDPFVFHLNFASVTELASDNDVTASNQDGFARGTLESFSIGSNGVISGVFSNGLTRTIGQVALASFSNVGGLLRWGNNTFRETPSSGLAQVGLAGTGGRGQISGGVLENSNVDLGSEFSNLIVTQRGFQANARTITAADTLLQETVNLVR
ncbi:MAG TPA: flagellar hook protein FlgE [Candidatus Hydrogenedentes bacterium]|nr:flagellar hook protein FlgE [Candidatus Hydrogenedentota bacterium]HOS02007.1 flagellar hook protein FlgE [Candidatus Hydrogenedentota bacterium]